MNKALVLFFCLIISLQSIGQNFGIKAGTVYSKEYVSWEDDQRLLYGYESSETKSSMSFGIYGRIPIGKKLSIVPELLYSQFEGTYILFSDNYKDEIKQFNLPIMFQWNPKKFIGVYLGPQFNFIIESGTTTDSNRLDNISLINSQYISAVAGVEFTLKDFDLGIRMIPGLSNLQNEDSYEFAYPPSIDVSFDSIFIYIGWRGIRLKQNN